MGQQRKEKEGEEKEERRDVGTVTRLKALAAAGQWLQRKV